VSTNPLALFAYCQIPFGDSRARREPLHLPLMVTNLSESDRDARARDVEAVAAAAADALVRIAGIIRRTPLVLSSRLSRETGAEVYFKLENRQHTGSFKLRGAANCLMSLDAGQRQLGVVTASSGNHGAAVAYAMRHLGITGPIFVPVGTSEAKVDAIRRYGGEVRFFGTDGVDTERHARDYAVRHGMYYVSPYNDAAVIAGQGTCGIEIADQLPDVDAAFIAVGGGGLMSGVGSVLKSRNPDLRLFGCQPAASAVMAKSVAAGKILDLPSANTLSDGTAGGIEIGSMTFALCRSLVDEFLLVTEEEIATAMRDAIGDGDDVIEGAAGVAIAACRRFGPALAGRRVAVIVCGGNIAEDTLASVMSPARL
jgi:threonine dehydratase